MEIKVFGPGCANCIKLEESVRTAVHELGIDAQIVKISNIQEIIEQGIFLPPGLMINGKLKHSGRPLPDIKKIKQLIQEEIK
ncbi:MAG: thioredoxin family protein [Nitrospirota bacterium]